MGTVAADWAWREAPPRLPAGAVHLWAAETTPLCAQSHLLIAAELTRAHRIADPAQRAMYLGGRAGLRHLLCAYSGLDNAALRLGRGPRGKPKLLNQLPGGHDGDGDHGGDGGRELCFNYSLSGGWALYAFAWNRALGIDLETLPRANNSAGLARRVLSAAELKAWRKLPAPAADAAMLACWTRKEAYGKALGVGIRYHMRRAEVFADAGPRWRCAVAGLFPGTVADTQARVLHGVQLATPFPGIAALVCDGGAVAADGLRGWRWRPSTAARPVTPTQMS